MAEQKDFDDTKNNENSNKVDKVDNKLPRWFRNSFVDNTLKLFYPGLEGSGVLHRSFKEK